MRKKDAATRRLVRMRSCRMSARGAARSSDVANSVVLRADLTSGRDARGAHEPGQHTVRGIAAHLGMDKPAVTRNVDRLVELGLMKRAPDPADRRSVLMTPTAAGSACVAEFQRAAKQAIARR